MTKGSSKIVSVDNAFSIETHECVFEELVPVVVVSLVFSNHLNDCIFIDVY